MKLSVQKRSTGKKGETNQLRREGSIPAILYVENAAGTPIFVKGDEVQAVLRNMKQGLLATTIFELDIGGKKQKAIIKDIQYHVATYDILHIDFASISDEKSVTVNVPIQLTGVADCVGVKSGGFIRPVIRTVKVSCLPKHIPQELSINVRDLDLGQSKTLADISIPAHVQVKAKMSEVVVLVGKKAGAA